MCQFASAFFKPDTMDIKVADLTSHANTADALGLKDDDSPDSWREMHYTPNDEVVCRCLPGDSRTSEQAVEYVRKEFPTFGEFLAWANTQPAVAAGQERLVRKALSADGKTLDAGGNCGITDAGIKGMKLTALDAGGNSGITDAEIKGMKLTALSAGYNSKITDAGIKGMKLTTLDAGGNSGITDAGIKGMKLTTLYAGGNSGITDAGIKGLTKLTTLYAGYNSGITDAARNQVAKRAALLRKPTGKKGVR
jgi:hypothetical protein